MSLPRTDRREYRRQWYIKNREQQLEWHRKRYIERRDEILEYQSNWRKNNPDKVRAMAKAYLPTLRTHYADNPTKYILIVNARRAKTRTRIDSTKISNWKSKICGICSEIIVGKFHIDHMTPLSKGGKHELDNLQLTHPKCNLQKGNKISYLHVCYS